MIRTFFKLTPNEKEKISEQNFYAEPSTCICESFVMTLRNDGNVEVIGDRKFDPSLKKYWNNVVRIFSGRDHVIGLKQDGSVVSFGDNTLNQCNVKNWRNIVLIKVSGDYTIGITSDNYILKTGISTSELISNLQNKVKELSEKVSDMEILLKADRKRIVANDQAYQLTLSPETQDIKINSELSKSGESVKDNTKINIPSTPSPLKKVDSFSSTKQISIIEANDSKTISKYYRYHILEDHIAIIKYIGNEQNVTIPSMIKGKPVRIIEKEAFMDCELIREINIPEKVIFIGESAFKNCKNLIHINIPSKVSIISSNMFCNCTALSRIDFAERGINSVGTGVFVNCKAISKISFPATVKSLGANMFCGCNNLKTIEIPEGVTQIHSRFVSNCPNLRRIIIPKSVKNIHPNAFLGSRNIVIVTDISSYAAEFARNNKIKFKTE